MKYIDNFLNKITMYKVVLYTLSALALISIIFGFTGLLFYNGLNLLLSLFVLFFACYYSNILIAKIFNVQTNAESSAITALILFFISFPAYSFSDYLLLALLSIVAMGSKYFLAIKKKHIFNPSAVSIFILGLCGASLGAWWVGSSVLLLPVIVVVFLILRKLQRFEMFSAFIVASLLSISIVSLQHGVSIYEALTSSFFSGPLIFFAGVMLTEPLTTPPQKKFRILYGIFVGILAGIQFHIGPIYNSPILILLLGNILSYVISPRERLVLTLAEKNELSKDVFEFVWNPDQLLPHKAGQYLEWTLGHDKPDTRGNRRFFTISSSPTEKQIRLGIKFYDNSSSFKKKLRSLNVGDQIIASQLAGEFTLPEDKSKKLVFIAGGIGVTPFRSMAKYLSDRNEKRDITLFYSNRTPKDIVYKDIFKDAENKVGMKTIYTVNDLVGELEGPDMKVGFIDAEMIIKEVTNAKDCFYYISGPRVMVTAFEQILKKMGIKKSQIKIDFFPGFV